MLLLRAAPTVAHSPSSQVALVVQLRVFRAVHLTARQGSALEALLHLFNKNPMRIVPSLHLNLATAWRGHSTPAHPRARQNL